MSFDGNYQPGDEPGNTHFTISISDIPKIGRPPGSKNKPKIEPADISDGGIAGAELAQFVERIERLEEEKKALSDDIKEIFGELKGRGFDVKAVRQIVRYRKMDHSERMELEAILELYMQALGMT